MARVAAAMNKILRKGHLQAFDRLTSYEPLALEILESRLMETPVFALPLSQDSTWLTQKHARSRIYLSFCRFDQKSNGTEWPTRYLSRMPKDAKCASSWEYLAVVWDVMLIWNLLEGCRLTVQTDHEASKWTSNLMNSHSNPFRWLLHSSQRKVELKRFACEVHKNYILLVNCKSKTFGIQHPYKICSGGGGQG